MPYVYFVVGKVVVDYLHICIPEPIFGSLITLAEENDGYDIAGYYSCDKSSLTGFNFIKDWIFIWFNEV